MHEHHLTADLLAVPCVELRRQADSVCAQAGERKAAASASRASLLQARQELTRLQHSLDAARAAADPARISQGKLEARAAYRHVIASSLNAADRQHATSVWLRDIDRLNREGRRANRALSRADAAVRQWTQAALDAERQADAARISAESATAACANARERLAHCEGATDEPLPHRVAPQIEETEESASRIRVGSLGPAQLVIERVAIGDRTILGVVAEELANLTGQPVSHYLLLLQEFVDALRGVTLEHRFLAFEDAHPLWSQFNREERQTIVAALSDLGFRYDPDEGWYGGRLPGTGDMAMAMAYAGHDPRTVRRLLTADELRTLPFSIVLSPVECLAALAPDLSLTQMFELFGPRADALGALWDDWSRLRSLFLSDAGMLVPA